MDHVHRRQERRRLERFIERGDLAGVENEYEAAVNRARGRQNYLEDFFDRDLLLPAVISGHSDIVHVFRDHPHLFGTRVVEELLLRCRHRTMLQVLLDDAGVQPERQVLLELSTNRRAVGTVSKRETFEMIEERFPGTISGLLVDLCAQGDDHSVANAFDCLPLEGKLEGTHVRLLAYTNKLWALEILHNKGLLRNELHLYVLRGFSEVVEHRGLMVQRLREWGVSLGNVQTDRDREMAAAVVFSLAKHADLSDPDDGLRYLLSGLSPEILQPLALPLLQGCVFCCKFRNIEVLDQEFGLRERFREHAAACWVEYVTEGLMRSHTMEQLHLFSWMAEQMGVDMNLPVECPAPEEPRGVSPPKPLLSHICTGQLPGLNDRAVLAKRLVEIGAEASQEDVEFSFLSADEELMEAFAPSWCPSALILAVAKKDMAAIEQIIADPRPAGSFSDLLRDVDSFDNNALMVAAAFRFNEGLEKLLPFADADVICDQRNIRGENLVDVIHATRDGDLIETLGIPLIKLEPLCLPMIRAQLLNHEEALSALGKDRDLAERADLPPEWHSLTAMLSEVATQQQLPAVNEEQLDVTIECAMSLHTARECVAALDAAQRSLEAAVQEREETRPTFKELKVRGRERNERRAEALQALESVVLSRSDGRFSCMTAETASECEETITRLKGSVEALQRYRREVQGVDDMEDGGGSDLTPAQLRDEAVRLSQSFRDEMEGWQRAHDMGGVEERKQRVLAALVPLLGSGTEREFRDALKSVESALQAETVHLKWKRPAADAPVVTAIRAASRLIAVFERLRESSDLMMEDGWVDEKVSFLREGARFESPLPSPLQKFYGPDLSALRSSQDRLVGLIEEVKELKHQREREHLRAVRMQVDEGDESESDEESEEGEGGLEEGNVGEDEEMGEEGEGGGGSVPVTSQDGQQPLAAAAAASQSVAAVAAVAAASQPDDTEEGAKRLRRSSGGRSGLGVPKRQRGVSPAVQILDLQIEEILQKKRDEGLTSFIQKERSSLLRQASLHFPELLHPNAPWYKRVVSDCTGLPVFGGSEALGRLGVWVEGRCLEDFPQRGEARDTGRHKMRVCTDEEGKEWVVKEYDLADPQVACVFYSQAARLHELRHAHLVQISAVFQEGTKGYIQMPKYPKGDLRQWMTAEENDLSLRDVGVCKKIVGDVLAGLAHVHSRGFVHCDVKPSNVLLTSELRGVLSDFDGVWRQHRETLTLTTVAAPRQLQTTIAYMAPELSADSPSPPTHASDIFSAGVLVRELFQGVSLGTNGGGEEEGGDESDMPSSSSSLQELVAKMTAENPADRPPAAECLLHPFLAADFPPPSEPCLFCFEVCRGTDGLICKSSSAAHHFICDVCLNNWVTSMAEPDGDSREIREHEGHLGCRGEGCVSARWTPHEISGHLRPEVYERYDAIRMEEIERRLHEGNEQEIQQRVLAQLQQGEAVRHQHIVEETILTLRCPRPECGQAFVNFEGCFALTCSRCRAGFCGWCLADCGDDAHAHVATCQHSLDPGDVFGTIELFEQAQRESKRRKVDEYIQNIADEALQREVRELLEIQLRDL
uniref:Protein kinase domain-containing protein n=1 Tax=Chromera velia CCMP2878 TaxID=1169474 RepID=A0A0G4HBZ4_9ALVE|eukprot:Cvel_6266.t1-p1 / transcript=Cvel_6266.t1 / gene=Cvel_6266 / organism=Chromera_velia_CCMP2878 / gene_product=L-type lectin-domain containing receptor kinase S.1, putative / transcript_product=L-type lectin-domain containing receptor kinase S.1, putative / location=Cvel_scaffold303:93047-98411(+) / protein_length=1569 / sequence_SO=supercontig / SO=protein_coding / is_pseudo=false